MKTYNTPTQITGLSTGWNTVDLDTVDGSLPTGTTGCAILFNNTSTVDRHIGLRKTGDTGNTGNLQYDTASILYCEIDGSNQVDVYIGFTDVDAYLLVAFSAEVTWIAEGSQISTTVSSASTWEDWDVSSVVPSTAKWVLGYTESLSTLFSAYVRPDGSSTSITSSVDVETRGFCVPAKNTQIIEIYSDTTTNATFYVVGYVNDTASSTEKTDAVNLTGEGSGGTFGTLDQSAETLPPGAQVAVIQPFVNAVSERLLWIRAGDGTQTLYSTHDQVGTGGLWTIPLDSSEDIEATAENTSEVDFYLWGWFGAPVLKNVPALSLALSVNTPDFSPHQYFPGTLSLPITFNAPDYSRSYYSPTLSLPISFLVPPARAQLSVPAESLALSFPGATWYWDGEGVPIYRLYLTGSGDATTDVELPMSTFTARIQSGEPTYVQVTVPDSTTYSAAVQARPNGEIVVYRGIVMADGSENLRELTRASFDTLSDDRGNTGASTLTLSGSKTETTDTPKTRTMTGLSYRRGGTNARRYRCSVDTHLKAGDTVVFPEFGDESITVGQIYLNVTVQGESMELEEAT